MYTYRITVSMDGLVLLLLLLRVRAQHAKLAAAVI
jgi:hypothetical protein